MNRKDTETRQCREKPFCRELLHLAFGGIWRTDQSLEYVLDYLERAS